MCDYSLHNVRSRPAKVSDRLTNRTFGTVRLRVRCSGRCERSGLPVARD